MAENEAPQTLADRMYASATKVERPHNITPPSAAPVPDSATASADPAPEAPSLDSLVDREPTQAERMLEQAAVVPDSPSGYDRALGAGFDAIEQAARESSDPEEIKALAEGRKVAGELLSEFGVRGDEAREITGTLSEWHGKLASGYQMSDDVLDDSGNRAETELRGEWGKDYNARVTLARRTAAEAMKRAPWLRDLIERTPAGNDPKLIRHFAELGLRNARKARRNTK